MPTPQRLYTFDFDEAQRFAEQHLLDLIRLCGDEYFAGFFGELADEDAAGAELVESYSLPESPYYV